MITKRSKTNSKFFQDIQPLPATPAEEALKMLRKKYNLKDKRTVLVKKAAELRKEVYNLSQEITQLELRLDKLLLEKVLKEK